MFADDTKVYTTVENRRDQEKLQRDLLKLCEWTKLWLQEFSVQNCKLVLYGNIQEHADYKYKLRDKDSYLQSLPRDTTEKDLGI